MNLLQLVTRDKMANITIKHVPRLFFTSYCRAIANMKERLVEENKRRQKINKNNSRGIVARRVVITYHQQSQRITLGI